MMYYTKTEFLKKYGGNLKQLFSKHFKLINGVYTKKDNGPSIPITWIRGDNTLMIHNTPPNLRKESEAGYIQVGQILFPNINLTYLLNIYFIVVIGYLWFIVSSAEQWARSICPLSRVSNEAKFWQCRARLYWRYK